MADLSWFIQQGWRNIWKQKTIWLFSALPILFRPVVDTVQPDQQNIGALLLYLAINIAYAVLWVVSWIGVPYLAYRFSTDRPATIQETMAAIRQFAGRILGCSCMGILAGLPIFFLALGIALRNSPMSQAVHIASLGLTPLSIFSCLWSFVTFGFFENDWGIRKSLVHAWNLFISHFGVLAILGLCLILIFQVSFSLVTALTVWMQPGLDVPFLGIVDFANPVPVLEKNPLFLLLNGINGILYSTFSTSVFVLAYLKYRGSKYEARNLAV